MSRDARRTPTGEKVGEALAIAIENSHSQRRLAEALGVSDAAVSRWISGAIPDSWLRLREICLVVGASADSILGIYQTQVGANGVAEKVATYDVGEAARTEAANADLYAENARLRAELEKTESALEKLLTTRVLEIAEKAAEITAERLAKRRARVKR